MKEGEISINGERKATRKGEVGDEGRVSGERRRVRELSKPMNDTFGEVIKFASANRPIDARKVLQHNVSGTYIGVSNSELPICPSGSPTNSPLASRVMNGYFAKAHRDEVF